MPPAGAGTGDVHVHYDMPICHASINDKNRRRSNVKKMSATMRSFADPQCTRNHLAQRRRVNRGCWNLLSSAFCNSVWIKLNVNVMLSNITFLMIFAGFDPSLLTLFNKLQFLILTFAVLLSRLCNESFCNALHRESKKTRHQTLGHNFSNYYPIFKIFSLSDSAVNLQQIRV